MPHFFCVCVSDFCPSLNTSLIQFSACKLNSSIFSQTNYFSMTPSFTARVVLPWPISACWCDVSCRLWPVLEPFHAFCPLGIHLRINFPHSFLSLVYIFISWPVFTVEHRLECHTSGVLVVPNTLLDTFSCHLILRRTCQQWNLSGSWIWCSW